MIERFRPDGEGSLDGGKGSAEESRVEDRSVGVVVKV